MSYTLLMTWDIKDNMEQEYFEFVVREWVPTTSRLGLKMVAAWYTQYAADDDVPVIRAEGIVDDLATMRQILESAEWKEMHQKLLDYVDNYQHKVVETTGEFKL